jgi:hypothetical protein
LSKPVEPGRVAVESFLAAAQAGDWGRLRDFMHADAVVEWPQSGERFRGVDNAIGAMSAQTDKPQFAGEQRITGSGSTWVLIAPLRYSDGVYQYIAVFELSGDKVVRLTEIFGAPFPAQEFRAQFVDRD